MAGELSGFGGGVSPGGWSAARQRSAFGYRQILTDVPVADEKFVNIAAGTSRFCTSTYAWAYPPAEIWTEFAKTDEKPRLWLANTAYVRDDDLNWMPRFLAQMSIMQPINAQIQAANMQDLIGGVADVSRPADMTVGGLMTSWKSRLNLCSDRKRNKPLDRHR